MHILWLVKTTLPQAAVACGLARASDVSGSWLTGQLAALRTHTDLHLTVLCVGKADASGAADGVDYRHRGRCRRLCAAFAGRGV